MSSSDSLTLTRHKTCLTTANPFEQQFGYHRAVRRGPFIAVSGTTALRLLKSQPPGSSSEDAVAESQSKVYFPGDVYRQTIHVLETCLAAVTRLGGKKQDVVRVRMFVANSDDCGTVGEAFREVFGARNVSGQDEDMVGAAATMIVVPGGFVDGEVLVEIEVEAFVV